MLPIKSKLHSDVNLVANSWDTLYDRQVLTPWEMLPQHDLQKFLESHCLGMEKINTILSIGCGRGRRDLIALSEIPELNRITLAYTGIDISAIAVEQARKLFTTLAVTEPIKDTCEFAEADGNPNLPRLFVRYQISRADVIEYLRNGNRYDAIIDWMCLHDLDVELRQTYADLVKASCDRYYILKTFSKEGSSLNDLGYVSEGIKKAQLSKNEICELFGPEFEIAAFQQDAEELDPVPAPPDRIIAAKRAYLMRRIV
jgi:hypothetical protein